MSGDGSLAVAERLYTKSLAVALSPWPRKALLRLGLRGAAGRFARWLDRRNNYAVVWDEAW